MTRAHKCRILLAATMATSAVATGCGQQKTIAAKTRPASPVTITAAISGGKVNLSPGTTGAGPILLSVANLSTHTVQLRVKPIDAGSGRANSGPINPQGTAQINVDLSPGTYRIDATGAPVSAGELKVGKPRQSSQNQVGLP